MLLDALKDFEWQNEPENVRFNENGMVVLSRNKTDFWQSKGHHFQKDDGHFFFCESKGDFRLITKWKLNEPSDAFCQSGMMLRVDEKNWFKFSLMSENKEQSKLGSSLTVNGSSDWAVIDLPYPVTEIWYKLVRNQDDYIAYYSLDGVKYFQHRLFYLPSDQGRIKVGAYIASPQQSNFEACLEILDLEA